MQVKFGTKHELKKMREEAFLKLSPNQRFLAFIAMIQESALLFGDKRPPKDSFVIECKQNDS